MQISFLLEAETEMIEVATYYQRQVQGLACEFAKCMYISISKVKK
jgi:hypothetical protein